MADEKKERRVKIEDLSEPEKELATDEQKQVKGGADSPIQSPKLSQLFDASGFNDDHKYR